MALFSDCTPKGNDTLPDITDNLVPFLIYLRRKEKEKRYDIAYFQLERAEVIPLSSAHRLQDRSEKIG